MLSLHEPQMPGTYFSSGDRRMWHDDVPMTRKSIPELVEPLPSKAAKLHPGESGLLALDWWNGQRTPLVDSRLSGAMLGMTLRTTPAEQ